MLLSVELRLTAVEHNNKLISYLLQWRVSLLVSTVQEVFIHNRPTKTFGTT